MSRTDKDDPYRVKIADRTRAVEEIHRHHGIRDCDLPARDAATATATVHWRDRPWCGYVLTGPSYWDGHVPREFVRTVWTKPERARERRLLRDAERVFYDPGHRPGDPVTGWTMPDRYEDYDFENRQHRHSAAWLWW